VVAGWASVNEGTQGPPVWDLVETYVANKKLFVFRPAPASRWWAASVVDLKFLIHCRKFVGARSAKVVAGFAQRNQVYADCAGLSALQSSIAQIA